MAGAGEGRRLEEEQGRLLAARAAQAELDRLQRLGLVPLGVFQRMRAAYQGVIARSERQLQDLLVAHSIEEQRQTRAVRRRLLAVEKSAIQDAIGSGILSDEGGAALTTPHRRVPGRAVRERGEGGLRRMYVLVAGGGHMGTHLVGRLVEHGHETAVIDATREVTERIFNEQGVVVFTGSATDMDVLERAGIKRADVAVAMTGRDADNLAFCLLSRYYGVPRVLARMLNPQYEVPYRLVGATKVHSEADIIVSSFLTSIEYPEVGALMPLARGELVIAELRIPEGSRVAGQEHRDHRPHARTSRATASSSGSRRRPTCRWRTADDRAGPGTA